MRATCHVARYFHIVGLVGQNKPRKLAPVHQPPEGFRIGRAAADNAMGRQVKTCRRDGRSRLRGRGRRWALLQLLHRQDDPDQSLGVRDPVISIGAPAGSAPRTSILSSSRFIAPFRLRLINSKTQQALLVVGQMVVAQARRVAEAKRPRAAWMRKPPSRNLVVPPISTGTREAKRADRGPPRYRYEPGRVCAPRAPAMRGDRRSACRTR